MAMDSCVHVVLYNPGGNQITRTANFNPINGSLNVEGQIKNARLQVIGVWIVRDQNGDAGGPFWDEYSGNSAYSVIQAYDGISMVKRDTTGAAKGAAIKSYFNDGSNPTGFQTVASPQEDIVMAQGAQWTVLDDGQGSLYQTELETARVSLGLNPDGTLP